MDATYYASLISFVMAIMFYAGLKGWFGAPKYAKCDMLRVFEKLSKKKLFIREVSETQESSGDFYVEIAGKRFAAVEESASSNWTVRTLLGFLTVAMVAGFCCAYRRGMYYYKSWKCATEQMENCEQELEELCKNMDLLNEQLAVSRRENEAVTKIKLENQNLKIEVKTQEEKREFYVHETYLKFNEQNIQLQKLIAENQMLKDETDNLRENLFDKALRNKHLDELLMLKTENEKILEQALRDDNTTLESMAKDMSELEKELEVTQECHKSALEESNRLRNQLQEKCEENETLKHCILHFKDNLDALLMESVRKDQTIREMETKCSEANLQTVEYKNKFEETAQALKEAETLNQNTSNQINCLKEQFRKVTEALGEYNQALEKAEAYNNELELELKKHQNKVAVLNDYNQRLNHQLKVMTECFNVINNKIQQTDRHLTKID